MNNKEKNRKRIIIGTLVALSLATSLTLTACGGKKTNESHEDKVIQQNKQSQLPAISNLKDSQKLMYDFQDGFVGEKSDYGKMIDQMGTYVYVVSDKMDEVYASIYYLQDKVGIVPNLGSKPFDTGLDASKFKRMLNSKEFQTKFGDKIVKEEGYTFFFANNNDKKLQPYLISKGVDYQKDLTYQDKKPDASPFNDRYLKTGIGYPTEILRREPYKTGLKEQGIDIMNKWWDTYNYMSVAVYYPNGIKNSDKMYTLTTPNSGKFNMRTPDDFVFSFTTTQGANGEPNTAKAKLEDYLKSNKLEIAK